MLSMNQGTCEHRKEWSASIGSRDSEPTRPDIFAVYASRRRPRNPTGPTLWGQIGCIACDWPRMLDPHGGTCSLRTQRTRNFAQLSFPD